MAPLRHFLGRHATELTAFGTVAIVLLLGLVTHEGRSIVQAILDGDSRRLREELLDLHVVGVLVLLTVILSHAIVPFPTELVTGAAGFVYGFAAAFPMLLLFWLASGMLAYWLAGRYGRPLARRVVGARRLRRAEEFVARGGPVPLISVRMVPFIPYNAICYAAGIVRVPERRYAWTTLVGIAPLTALVAYLGSRLQQPNFGNWRLWAAIAGFTALAVLAQVVERRVRRPPPRHT
jgi:uncharacterized membrane protein YdjX (TVP38/TMEM64 family)